MSRLLRKATPWRAWLDPAVAPLVGAVACGSSMGIWFCLRNTFWCADTGGSFACAPFHPRRNEFAVAEEKRCAHSFTKKGNTSNVERVVFNEGNTAATSSEQHLFLGARPQGSTRLYSNNRAKGSSERPDGHNHPGLSDHSDESATPTDPLLACKKGLDDGLSSKW